MTPAPIGTELPLIRLHWSTVLFPLSGRYMDSSSASKLQEQVTQVVLEYDRQAVHLRPTVSDFTDCLTTVPGQQRAYLQSLGSTGCHPVPPSRRYLLEPRASTWQRIYRLLPGHTGNALAIPWSRENSTKSALGFVRLLRYQCTWCSGLSPWVASSCLAWYRLISRAR